MTAYSYPKGRRVLSVPAPTLNRMLVRDAYRYATLAEYAQGSGLPVEGVLEAIEPYLDEGCLALEVAEGEIFVLTAPGGRPIPDALADVAPNLWETFRLRANVSDAGALWRLTRGLEAAGWAVEVSPSRVAYGLGHVASPPSLGIGIAGGIDEGGFIAPVVAHPRPDYLSEDTGPLGQFERAGAQAVAVVCAAGRLDGTVTAVRRWFLGRTTVPSALRVIILEEPSLQPVILAATDASVAPVSVTRESLGGRGWDQPQH